MAIPQQVKQRSEQANKFFEQQQAQPAQQPGAEGPDDAQRDQEERAREEQAAAEQQEAEAQQAQDDGVPQSHVEQHGEEPREPPTQNADETAQKVEKLSQQLSTLQGMMRSTADENQQLRAIIAQMNEKSAQPEQSTSSAPAPSADDSKDAELFGEDFVEMVERRISNRLNGLESRLSKAEGSAQKSERVSTEVRQERFEKRLAEREPNWQEIDSDPDFREWVSNSNTRVAFIQQAMADYDADAIADIFEQYKALTGKGQQPQNKPAEPAKRSLESKVSPSKGRTSTSAGGAGEKKTWTRSEIAQVFANRRNIPQEEFAELQRDIFAAQKEGRVDYSK